jgi:hypothetical protein
VSRQREPTNGFPLDGAAERGTKRDPSPGWHQQLWRFFRVAMPWPTRYVEMFGATIAAGTSLAVRRRCLSISAA